MRQSWIESFDGTKIGYRLRGEGRKVLVFCNGLSTTESYWKYLIRHFSTRYRVLTWDYRGHGSSYPPMNTNEISIESHARDLNLILDAEQIERPAIGGFSMGVQVCLEYYRLFPEKCAGLILVAGPSGKPLNSVYIPKLAAKIFPLIFPVGVLFKRPLHYPVKFLVQSPLIYPFCLAARMISPAASKKDMQDHYNSIARIDIGLFLRMVKAMHEHDADAILSQVKVPTLVVAGASDMFTLYHAQEKTYRKIPGAELLRVPLGTHVVPIEQPELINLRTDKFLEERVWPPKKSRGKPKPLSMKFSKENSEPWQLYEGSGKSHLRKSSRQKQKPNNSSRDF